jgi:hypothetical protein
VLSRSLLAVCPPCNVSYDLLGAWEYNFTSRVPACEQGVRALNHHFRLATRFPLLDSDAGGVRKLSTVWMERVRAGGFHRYQQMVAESASYEDCTRVNRWYKAHYAGFLAPMLHSDGIRFQTFKRLLKRLEQERPASDLEARVWASISGVPTVWNCRQKV